MKPKVRRKRWSFGAADAVRLRDTKRSINVAFDPDQFSKFLGEVLAANTWVRSINLATQDGKRAAVGLTFHKSGEGQGYVIVHRERLTRKGR